MSHQHPPKVLFFDVFGTVVDWRSSITAALIKHSQEALHTKRKKLRESIRKTASSMQASDWAVFAQEWRNSYSRFTKNFDPTRDTFITIDEHHYNSLKLLLCRWNLLWNTDKRRRDKGDVSGNKTPDDNNNDDGGDDDDLFTDAEIRELSLSWHFLTPWDDSVKGLVELNKRFVTSTLSNGNTVLLEDLAKHGSLPFKHFYSAEQFGAYKPSPAVYTGAAEKVAKESSASTTTTTGIGDCALVAAHLGDLKAAKKCGYQTIYVERPQEEGFTEHEVRRAKEEGWVDMWIEDEDEEGKGGNLDKGFIEIARRFGYVS